MDYSDGTVKKIISFGVNDSAEKMERDNKLFRAKKYGQLNSISCVRELKSYKLDGVDFGNIMSVVSYTRVGNILIGMDILSKMECHIITVKDSDKEEENGTYFIACPYAFINAGQADDFYVELDRLSNLGGNITSALYRNAVDDDLLLV